MYECIRSQFSFRFLKIKRRSGTAIFYIVVNKNVPNSQKKSTHLQTLRLTAKQNYWRIILEFLPKVKQQSGERLPIDKSC